MSGREKWRKQYSSVPEMVYNITGDKDLADEITEMSKRSRKITELFILRTKLNLSYLDLAVLTGISQARIFSIFEESVDSDVTEREFALLFAAMPKEQ